MKPCGRVACMDLLAYLDDDKYGNSHTGMLNVEEIIKLRNERLNNGIK